jgi:hypothetical protein
MQCVIHSLLDAACRVYTIKLIKLSYIEKIRMIYSINVRLKSFDIEAKHEIKGDLRKWVVLQIAVELIFL